MASRAASTLLSRASRHPRHSRAYAAAAAATAPVVPPIQLYGIEGRYATALWTAASKSSSLPKVESDVTKLASLPASTVTLLSSPLIPNHQKAQAVKALVEKGGLQSLTGRFLEVMAENGRLGCLEKALAGFEALMSKSRGEIKIVVTSATPLEKNKLENVKSSLQKGGFIPPGAPVKLESKVNADILGGLIIEVGESTIDMSVSSKLAKISQALVESV